ncbi:putative RNA methyltransferase [Arthrobacter sp. 260]|uniref:putative RNA methyltransferase n=1 Tax=Arthrobacter sp. 260 TaxID=2735314 RepID=UPI001490F7B4|nr:methyltransferase domain-containing protein [Arthrobacter sp. 260]NOJ59619.1 methyltransferase domain-containing protein [Arthrobacter sp. 260]
MPRLPENILRCPVCSVALELSATGRTLGCATGHRFDAAKQGYFNLLTGRGTPFLPDTAAMVQARTDFLGAGHYDRLRDTVSVLAQRRAVAPRVILDAGAGTGYYLDGLRRGHPEASLVALDISKFALRRAARLLDDDGVCLVWDVWRPLPIQDGAVDLLTNIFAPRNPEEFHRVLRPGGVLVVVTPLPGHLAEIADDAGLLVVPGDKADGVSTTLAGLFHEMEAVVVDYPLRLSRTDVYNAALMGPAGHHLDQAVLLDRLASLPEWTGARARFTVQVFGRSAGTATLADV